MLEARHFADHNIKLIGLGSSGRWLLSFPGRPSIDVVCISAAWHSRLHRPRMEIGARDLVDPTQPHGHETKGVRSTSSSDLNLQFLRTKIERLVSQYKSSDSKQRGILEVAST